MTNIKIGVTLFYKVSIMNDLKFEKKMALINFWSLMDLAEDMAVSIKTVEHKSIKNFDDRQALIAFKYLLRTFGGRARALYELNKMDDDTVEDKFINEYVKYYIQANNDRQALICRFMACQTGIRPKDKKTFNDKYSLNYGTNFEYIDKVVNTNFELPLAFSRPINTEYIDKVVNTNFVEQAQKNNPVVMPVYRSKLMTVKDRPIKRYYKGLKLTNPVKAKTIYKNYPVDDSYLFELLDSINFDNINNDYIIGLLNLLTDKDYTINTIGLKIVITKYLMTLNSLKDLKVIQVKNSYLNDDFSFLSYKNDKQVNQTKLYYYSQKNDIIVFNTLFDDRINSIILFDSTKYSYDDIYYTVHNKTVNDKIKAINNDIKHIEVNKNSYQYDDKEFKLYQYIIDLINVLKNFDNTYNDIIINQIDITNNNYFEYLNIIKSEYLHFYDRPKLWDKYCFILEYLKNDDIFKANDIRPNKEKTTLINEFLNYDSKDKVIIKSKVNNTLFNYNEYLKQAYKLTGYTKYLFSKKTKANPELLRILKDSY